MYVNTKTNNCSKKLLTNNNTCSINSSRNKHMFCWLGGKLWQVKKD